MPAPFRVKGPKTSLLVLHDTTAQRAARILLVLGMVAVAGLGIALRWLL